MRILITGVCGFVGSTLAKALLETGRSYELIGIDNFSRPGSELNRGTLMAMGVDVIHGDIRNEADLEGIHDIDWVLDAAANPSVLAGVDGKTTSRQLVDNNLLGTVNLLELCKRESAGFTLLSTSRVYSIEPLTKLKLVEKDGAYQPAADQDFPRGLSVDGVSESFSTTPPVSLYGSTKVASEHLALEYGHTFMFPVWINRCGVLAGAGQFGHPAQGIFSYWIHSFRERSKLKYIGFGGSGHQVRDCLHPADLVPVMEQQFQESLATDKPRTMNFSGGVENSISLRNLSEWCGIRFDPMDVECSKAERPFDIGWVVLDSSLAKEHWCWRPQISIDETLSEIQHFANRHENWLGVCNPRVGKVEASVSQHRSSTPSGRNGN